MPTTVFVSATPGDYELEHSGGTVVEQVIRPTGLVDPPITVLPVANQVDDLIERIRVVVARGERVLVTTLTKKMSEDLTDYLAKAGLKVTYLHSDITALDRIEILRKLRLGESDVLVGVNLLREGLDLPEVSLVAILDADREGFLRSARSLIQTVGPRGAQRQRRGDHVRRQGDPLDAAGHRRDRPAPHPAAGLQPGARHHAAHHLQEPQEIMQSTLAAGERGRERPAPRQDKPWEAVIAAGGEPRQIVAMLETEMDRAAAALEFEQAAEIRDRLEDLKAQWGLGGGGGQA